MSVLHPTEWLRAQDSGAVLARQVRAETGPRARLLRAFAAHAKRRRERRELEAMSDAELRDIGITRYDIDRVFDPGFAREYAAPGQLQEISTNLTKQETRMKPFVAALFVALLALTGASATAHAYYDAAPDRTTVSGNGNG
ncbi:MAG: DUF1127 domain-containing protein [Acetobacteraceae bacterium]|nr:DUF1127 domain-containing protein [Acetobacteraceae bacterium]